MVTQMKREHALELLGISDPISHADLRKRYRLKALKYHPDKTADGNSEMFRHIHDAYELLRLEIEQEEEIDEPPGGSGYEGYMARCMNAFGVTITKDQIDDIMSLIQNRCISIASARLGTETLIKVYGFFSRCVISLA